MALSGNKGEWSEIYTLFKLLGEGKVHAGDADMNKLDLYYPIINVIREESKKYEYKPNIDQNIVVIDEDGNEFAKIGCSKLKAPSRDKADIHIVIHDLRTNMTPLLGFSIKSQLGSASTLLNPGTTTNITYKVTGAELSDEEIDNINAVNDHLPRMQAIFDKGCTLKYYDIEHPIFKNNLLFLDTCMPQFIADCVLISSLPDSNSSVKECVAEVAKRNPLNFSAQGR